MKRIQILPMLAILLAMFVVLPSCKDDDKNDSGQDPNKQTDPDDVALVDNVEAKENALTFWSIASQLVGTDQYTDDYANATFEPIIGKEDGNTRIVATNTMEAAAQKFAYLTGADIDENTATFTYSDPAVGTLTYTKVNDGTTLATVDVNIKQIPHLEKIIYQAGSDDNGSFGEYKAYYRFGDIVSRVKDNITEYWICVRPAFTYEKKEDSHWVCVSELPNSNIYHFEKEGMEYYLPTKLGTNKEHMQNFAEMLYAIAAPQKWYDNCEREAHKGMKIFHDFSENYIEYHNQHFWDKVWGAWKNTPEVLNAFNIIQLEDRSLMAEGLETKGLSLLYSGYSWWTWKGNCDLYQATYTCGTTSKEKNMHHAEYKTISKKIYEFSLDFRNMGDDLDDYKKFFDDNKCRWVIRHATGKELNGDRQPAATAAIQGVQEVYRYYSYYPEEWEAKGTKAATGPEITKEEKPKEEKKYDTHYQPGDVLKDEQGNRWFCFLPAPYTPGIFNDRTAWFASLDFNGIDVSGNTVKGLVKEDDMIDYIARFANVIIQLLEQKDPAYKLTPNQLGKICEHIKEYAGVDFRHLFVRADSTWTFTNKQKKTYASNSASPLFCVAYDDGSTDRQAIARMVLDCTQAGKYRTQCEAEDGKKYSNWFYRLYKHYETYDVSRMTAPNEIEAKLGFTQYTMPWAISNDKMYLTDIADASLVSRYAKNDKWVTLPLYETTVRRQPRTQAVADVKLSDYIGSTSPKTNMFNEPVLFIRFMKVEDKAGTTPNLVSMDGRQLTVEHMQYDELMNQCNLSWNLYMSADWPSALFIDNQHVTRAFAD